MARNIPKSQHPAQDADAPEAEPTQHQGGAPGAPDDPNPAVAHVGGPRVHEGAKAKADPDAPAPVARRFRVVGGNNANERGNFRVMYNGMPTVVANGKEYLEHHADLDHLRSQGIRFEEVLPEAADE